MWNDLMGFVYEVAQYVLNSRISHEVSAAGSPSTQSSGEKGSYVMYYNLSFGFICLCGIFAILAINAQSLEKDNLGILIVISY